METKWTYDVFLSIHGGDTRKHFTSHLYGSLKNAGIKVFRGDSSRSVERAIEESRISVVVFSRYYGGSIRCLRELEKILECRRTLGQVVLPVFYYVDPKEVGSLTGEFGKAFHGFEIRVSAMADRLRNSVIKWKEVIQEAASIAGFEVQSARDASKEIKNIVEGVTSLLDKSNLFVTIKPVGVESRVQDMIHLLDSRQSNDVLLIGMCGIGGIGKTTIAKAIYDKIGHKFEARSFLSDIREVWEQWEQISGLVYLQAQLLKDISKDITTNIQFIESGKSILERILCHKRVLLVLDDVNNLHQLNALCGSRKWFGPGSRVIITTRDMHILRVRKVDQVYMMNEMNEKESIELFNWHAFKKASPRKACEEISKNVVKYCGGLPLALEVLGSYLFGRKVEECKIVLEKLKLVPHDQVHEKLKISYDGLNNANEKEIFLDIACFFIGMDRSDVVHILDGCGLSAEIGISILVDRRLVTVDDENKLGMHCLLQDMGKEIIRKESPKDPGVRSRLLFHNDVLGVLSKQTGTNTVKGLALKVPRGNAKHFSIEAFKYMKRLRLLQLDGVQLDGEFKYLSRNLRWLHWNGFPFTCIPADFYLANLVSLVLENSNMKLVWKETQRMENLKILNLSHSRYLIRTPDFSNLPNLEKLVLEDCPKLSEVSHSIGHLKKVLLINLKDCISLSNLPRSIYTLKSLKTLNLSGCLRIDKLEEDLEQMESLTTLIADNTAITKVPFSVVRLKSIGYISLCGYEGSPRDVFRSIVLSWMSPTSTLSALVPTSSTASMSSLASLDVQENVDIAMDSMLPSLWVEWGLEFQRSQDVAIILDALYATSSKELESIATTSQISSMGTSEFLIGSSNQVNILGSKYSVKSLLIQMGMSQFAIAHILQESILQNTSLLPDDRYPDWLSFTCEGSSVVFEVPQVEGHDLKTMICVVYSSGPDNITSHGFKNMLIINHTKHTIQLYKGEALGSFGNEEGQRVRVVSHIEPGNKVEVVVVFGNDCIVKKTTVYLLYDEPAGKKMEQCDALDENVIVLSGDENQCNVDSKDSIGIPDLARGMGREVIRQKSLDMAEVSRMARTYDVCLSFRGEDSDAKFSLHLYTSLRNAGIHVFRHDAEIQEDQISVSVLQAISQSRISVVVLSRNYANSRLSMLELENIMECRRTRGLVVLPVFFEVYPFEVRNQTGKFGEAFDDLMSRTSEDEYRKGVWTTALFEVSSLSGIVVINSRSEFEHVDNVLDTITNLLVNTDLFASNIGDVIQLLNSQNSEDTMIIGICGMGGIGKTTISKAVYNKICCSFEANSFLKNVRGVWKQDDGKVSLQQQLLYDICKTTEIEIDTVESGKRTLQTRLCQKRILLVLDDVNELDQLNALCGSREWFGQGSRILVSTRNMKILNELQVDHIYKMKLMEDIESLELLCWNAFKQPITRKGFAKLSTDVVKYCDGLPLALVVVGTFMHGKRETEWKSALEKFKMIPHDIIMENLRISYDDLSDNEKGIFLDISSFFIGMGQDDVIQILEHSGHYAETGIRVLVEQSLVTVDSSKRIGMHNLVRAMGKEIIRQKSMGMAEARIYDVFLSFRGEDTRAKFISHFYDSLQNAGIHVFRDNDGIQRGDQISVSLLQAIGQSRISVVVLSRNYPKSKWCMLELENIIESRRTRGLVVVPVFYEVDPSDVRYQTGKFGEAFKDLMSRILVDEYTKRKWETILFEVGSIAGVVIINSSNESNDMKKVIYQVTHLLNKTDLFVAEHPELCNCLCTRSF